MGGRGDDTIRGTAADNLLVGGRGDDRLLGGPGDDILVGGPGRDVLAGGKGRDLFVFATPRDSAVATGTDSIRDFTPGIDLLDLTALTGGTAHFLGSAAYTGAERELRIATTEDRTQIFYDADSDRLTDFRLELSGTPQIDPDDILV